MLYISYRRGIFLTFLCFRLKRNTIVNQLNSLYYSFSLVCQKSINLQAKHQERNLLSTLLEYNIEFLFNKHWENTERN